MQLPIFVDELQGALRPAGLDEGGGMAAYQALVVGIQVEPFRVQCERLRQISGANRVAGKLGPERHVVRV